MRRLIAVADAIRNAAPDFDPTNVEDRRTLAGRPEVVRPSTQPIERPSDPFMDKFGRFDFDREINAPVETEEEPAHFDPSNVEDRRAVAGRPEVARPGTERVERPDDPFSEKNERFGLDDEVVERGPGGPVSESEGAGKVAAPVQQEEDYENEDALADLRKWRDEQLASVTNPRDRQLIMKEYLDLVNLVMQRSDNAEILDAQGIPRNVEASEATAAPQSQTQATPTFVPEPAITHHEVGQNQTLSELAAIYGVTVEAIRNLNGLTSDNIFEGQNLYIPLDSSATLPAGFNFNDFIPFEASSYGKAGADHGTNLGASRTKLHPGIDIIPVGPQSDDFSVNANAAGNIYFFQSTSNGIAPFDPSAPNRYNQNFEDFGNYAVIESVVGGQTYYQVFAHMENFNEDLGQGQAIIPGTYLGEMGATGATDHGFGPETHVHWEVRREEGVRIESGVIYFDTLSNLGYYAASEEELDQFTLDPYIYAVILANANQ